MVGKGLKSPLTYPCVVAIEGNVIISKCTRNISICTRRDFSQGKHRGTRSADEWYPPLRSRRDARFRSKLWWPRRAFPTCRSDVAAMAILSSARLPRLPRTRKLISSILSCHNSQSRRDYIISIVNYRPTRKLLLVSSGNHHKLRSVLYCIIIQ